MELAGRRRSRLSKSKSKSICICFIFPIISLFLSELPPLHLSHFPAFQPSYYTTLLLRYPSSLLESLLLLTSIRPCSTTSLGILIPPPPHPLPPPPSTPSSPVLAYLSSRSQQYLLPCLIE